MDYLITDLDSLLKLEKRKDIKLGIRKIKFADENNEQLQIYERKLNKYYFACGCREGAVAAYFTLICFTILWWITGSEPVIGWWKVIAVIAFSALAGKIYGLLTSRFRLKKLYKVLEVFFIAQDRARILENKAVS